MKILFITFALVHIALCVDEDKLPKPEDLIAAADRTCTDFIAARSMAHCDTYGVSPNQKTVFFQLFAATAAETNFATAQAACNARGGYLATFNSDAQYMAVTTALISPLTPGTGTNPKVLLGIRDITTDGQGVFQNQDMIKDDVPPMATPTPMAGEQNVVVAIMGNDDTSLITSMIDTADDTVALTTDDYYMCRFNYISNSIVYINEVRNWNMAMTECQQIDGELMSLKDTTEKAALNCLLHERSEHKAWIGLNDLNEEGHFSWSDYSIAKFTPFCKKPEEDEFTKDCVFFQANNVDNHDNDKKAGCLKTEECNKNLAYVCKIRDPESDDQSVLFKEYLVHLLKDVMNAENVCSGTCGNGLSSMFGHKRPGSTIPGKRVRVIKKGRRGKGRRGRIVKHKKKVLPKHKKAGHPQKPKAKPVHSSASAFLSHLKSKF